MVYFYKENIYISLFEKGKPCVSMGRKTIGSLNLGVASCQ